MGVGIILTRHEMVAKSDIRVLGVQLDSKLRWKKHLRQVKTKLVIRHKGVSIIESSVFGTFVNVGKRKYTAIERPVIAHDVATWYTPAVIKRARKEVIGKLRSIQRQALRRITSAYKTIFTKTLQIETNISSIDIYLEKLVQRSMAIINAREFEKVIDIAILRIRNDLMSKRERRSRLRIISL